MAKTKYIQSDNSNYIEAAAYMTPGGYDAFWIVDFEGSLFSVGPEGAVVLRDLLNEVIKENKKASK